MSHRGCPVQEEAGVVVPDQGYLGEAHKLSQSTSIAFAGMSKPPAVAKHHFPLVLFSAGGGRGSGA